MFLKLHFGISSLAARKRKLRIWSLLTLSHKETTAQVPHPPSSLMQLTFSLKWKHPTVCVRNPLPQYLECKALGRADSGWKEPCHFQSGSSQWLSLC